MLGSVTTKWYNPSQGNNTWSIAATFRSWPADLHRHQRFSSPSRLATIWLAGKERVPFVKDWIAVSNSSVVFAVSMIDHKTEDLSAPCWLRKPPDIFCFTLNIRIVPSDWLLWQSLSGSDIKCQIFSWCFTLRFWRRHTSFWSQSLIRNSLNLIG